MGEKSKTEKVYAICLITFLCVMLVGAVTIITDSSVQSPTGDYSDLFVEGSLTFDNDLVGSLNLPGIPLVFRDGARIFALFNGNATFTTTTIQQTPVFNITNGTSTLFIGDVDNIDNVNGQSRFRETNLNNGTAATSAFTVVNDLGHSTAFGIGSSNFEFAGVPFPNEAAIFHDGPGEFNIANGYDYGWDWRANQLNQSGNFDFVESMQLSPRGNLNIDGNYSGDNILLRAVELKHTCNLDSQGTIVYEGNGSKGDFFGCTRLNLLAFSWKKL